MPRSNVRRNYALDNDVNTGRANERRCTQCDTWLPETEANFSWGANRYRYNAWCKPCVRAYRRNTVSANVGTGRRFGVEIEFIGSSNAVAAAMVAVGLSCSVQSYNHRVSRTSWKIVPDGSVQNGAELVSPILRGADGFAQLVKVGEALAAANATVNKSTGLHVHHDVRDLTVSAFRTLVHSWHDSQAAIDELVSKSRRANRSQWCQALTSYELEAIDGIQDMARTGNTRYALQRGTRYRTLNLHSYPKYGTVEVRQHQGTTDDVKIAAWVRFGQAMIEAATTGTRLAEVNGVQLVNQLPLADDTKAYLVERIVKLNQQAVNA